MANSVFVVINAVYNNDYGEPVSQLGPRLTAEDDLFDGSKGWLVKASLSFHCVSQEIFVFSEAWISSISLFL